MYCLDCKYPLSQVGGANCPECGRGFNVADPQSFFATRAEINEWQRFERTRTAFAFAVTAMVVLIAFVCASGLVLSLVLHRT